MDTFENELKSSLPKVAELKSKHDALKEDNFCEMEVFLICFITSLHNKGVAQIMNQVEELWEQLSKEKHDKKKKVKKDLKTEQDKEKLRLEFAQLAKELGEWVSITVEAVHAAEFGEDLESVAKYKEVLDADDQKCYSELLEKKEVIDKNLAKQDKLNVTENVHTSLGKADIEALNQRVLDALQERKGRYEKELARQEAMEAKRKEFAAAAQKVKEFLESQRAAVDSLNGKQK